MKECDLYRGSKHALNPPPMPLSDMAMVVVDDIYLKQADLQPKSGSGLI